MSKYFEYLTISYFTCVTAPVTIHEAFCTGNINKSQTTSEHDWRRGCCAEAERVRAAGDINVCVGVRGECFSGTCAHPVGQSSISFTHSFTAPECHHIISRPTSYTRAPCAWPCLLLHDEQHDAGVCRRKEPRWHTGAVTDFNLTVRYWTLDKLCVRCTVRHFPQINHIRMQTSNEGATEMLPNVM